MNHAVSKLASSVERIKRPLCARCKLWIQSEELLEDLLDLYLACQRGILLEYCLRKRLAGKDYGCAVRNFLVVTRSFGISVEHDQPTEELANVALNSRY